MKPTRRRTKTAIEQAAKYQKRKGELAELEALVALYRRSLRAIARAQELTDPVGAHERRQESILRCDAVLRRAEARMLRAILREV